MCTFSVWLAGCAAGKSIALSKLSARHQNLHTHVLSAAVQSRASAQPVPEGVKMSCAAAGGLQ